ncbi:MAG TPA: tol-pal system protein YbgF [Gemmatimonadaceae bacterium]
MIRGVLRLAPVVALAAGACVATRDDIRILQNDLAVMRAEQAQRDSVESARLAAVVELLDLTQDSLRAMSARVVRLQGDVRGDLYALGQQLLQVQELSGQSQRRLQELRASMEARQLQMQQEAAAESAAVVRPSGARAPSGQAPAGQAPPPQAVTPGPNQLFQLALDQLRRGSTGAARLAFQDLLRQYPSSDVAPDALYYIGESYAQEGSVQSADSAFGAVVARFPESGKAPTAMYKRAGVLRGAGNPQAARAVLEALVRQYPRSAEADLAREMLQTPR